MPRRLMALALLVLAGCADDGEPLEEPRLPGRYSLVNLRTMQPVLDPGGDPFAARRPDAVRCDNASTPPATGWELYEGADSFYVETWRCNYHAAQGGLLVPLQPGDVGIIRLFHFQIDGAVGDTAHLGLAVGGAPVWEKTVTLGPAAFVTERWIVPQAWPPGTPVVLQVDNHGNNSYQFLEVGVIVE